VISHFATVDSFARARAREAPMPKLGGSSSSAASPRASTGTMAQRPSSMQLDDGTTVWCSNGAMAFAFFQALQPPLPKKTLQALRSVTLDQDVSLSMLSSMGLDHLTAILQKQSSDITLIESARIISAIGPEPLKCLSPPPLGPNGEPVVVRPKIGFTNLNNIDTVGQTVFVRFFLDLYWEDPRMVGATIVPENIWRPAECYIINQVEDMNVLVHEEQPILVDASKGLLLWPIEFCGAVVNPMDLREFPFDRDSIDVHVHQAESSSRDEYILRPFEKAEEEEQSVRFFFDVFSQVTEFEVQGFSKECWEQMGGNLKEYSHCLLQLYTLRRSRYYIYKVAVPVLLCTVFCFSAFFFPVDGDGSGADASGHMFNAVVDVGGLSERNNLAATMFLAAAALMYVVSAELPKVSYLTTMDYFVNFNLGIQFAIAVTSWITTSVFGTISNGTASTVNLIAFVTLLVAALASSVVLMLVPALRELEQKRTNSWPPSLGREVPEVVYYKFANFVNCFPPWQQGTKNPIALPPKHKEGSRFAA